MPTNNSIDRKSLKDKVASSGVFARRARHRGRAVVCSFALAATLALHALMILPLLQGAHGSHMGSLDTVGDPRIADDVDSEPVLTVMLLNESMHRAQIDLPKPPSLDLETASLSADLLMSELPPVIDLLENSASAGVDLPISSPPTEVTAHVPYGERGERVGEVVQATDVVQACRQAHPVELSRGDHEINVSLRVFVLPDGRIAQGEVAVSSGNAEFDRVVFQCVQAYANVNPMIVNSDPVGSWQTIATHW